MILLNSTDPDDYRLGDRWDNIPEKEISFGFIIALMPEQNLQHFVDVLNFLEEQVSYHVSDYIEACF